MAKPYRQQPATPVEKPPTPINKTCGTCAFLNKPELRCHRSTPVPVPGYVNSSSVWPVVKLESWCGEWRPDDRQ